MPRQSVIFNIVEGAQMPFMNFAVDGVEAGDFTSITLEVRRSDGKLLTKTAVVDDPGIVTQNIPLSFHFEWDPGDIITGNHNADLVMLVGGAPLRIPEISPILIVAREKA